MKEHFKTTDLWLTAYLLARGANLTGLEKNHLKPSQYVFILSGEDLQGNTKSYSENGKIPVLSYKQILLDLKHQIYRKNENINMGGKNGYERTSKTG